MEKKHGELKIMTAKEMVDAFLLDDARTGMDFATLEFTKKELHGIPAKYLDIERVYDDAWGWNGIRVMESPLDTDETIIVIGHYGSAISDCMAINTENLTYDCYGIGERIRNAVHWCESYEIDDDMLLIVEMHDEMYKRVEEDTKCERILADAKKKMRL